MIEWNAYGTDDIKKLGKWLNWAQSWAEFKAQSNEDDPADLWRYEARELSYEQSNIRTVMSLRNDPYAIHGPSM